MRRSRSVGSQSPLLPISNKSFKQQRSGVLPWLFRFTALGGGLLLVTYTVLALSGTTIDVHIGGKLGSKRSLQEAPQSQGRHVITDPHHAYPDSHGSDPHAPSDSHDHHWHHDHHWDDAHGHHWDDQHHEDRHWEEGHHGAHHDGHYHDSHWHHEQHYHDSHWHEQHAPEHFEHAAYHDAHWHSDHDVRHDDAHQEIHTEAAPVDNHQAEPQQDAQTHTEEVHNEETHAPEIQIDDHTAHTELPASGHHDAEEHHEDMAIPIPVVPPSGLYRLSAKDIDGNEVPLSKYAGKVTLVVNVASACGYTDSNYKGIMETYTKYKNFGLEVLAFPCNQFGQQEPGSEAEIKEFCSSKYHVDFPIFAKVDVNGPNTHPVFEFLKRELPEQQGGGGGKGPGKDLIWNFQKFLVDPYGQPLHFYYQNYDQGAIEHDIYDMLAKIQPQ